MKRVKKWTSLLLAAILLLGLLSTAAMAEEIPSGTVDVGNFEEFQSALEDDAVEGIRITGDVSITAEDGTLQNPLEADKPITVALNGSLILEEGAALSCGVPMGQFDYELPEDEDVSVWDRIVDGAAVFLVWEGNGEPYRLLLGSHPENLSEALRNNAHGSLTMAVFRDGVTLDGDVAADQFYVMSGDLNIPKGSKLTVEGFLWVDQNIHDFGQGLEAENVACNGDYHHPHLTYRWFDEPEDHMEPNRDLSMTPYDEYEIIFQVYEYDEDAHEWVCRELDADDLQAPGALSYRADENHQDRLTLTAENAEWNRTYTVKTKDGSYDIAVRIELPDVGFYNAPAATEANFIDTLKYNPLSDNKFYVCVNPIRFKDGWKVDDDLNIRAVQYDEDGGHDLGQLPHQKTGNGIWEVTATGCELSVEAEVSFRHDEWDIEYTSDRGLWIESVERLVYSGAPLTGDGNDWGLPWQDGFQSSLHDTLSLRTGSSADVRLYLLVYQWESEGSKPAGWYCEDVNINQIRSEGVSVTQANEADDHVIRVTAQSPGAHKVIRLQEREAGPGEYELVPGSTRGIPLTVTVTRGDSSGTTSGGSSGGSSNSSSSSTPTYSVSAPAQVTGGTVKVTPASAQKGQLVTITVKAASGYMLEEVSVTDSKGGKLAVTSKGSGIYTFTMPAGKVTVTPVFRSAAAQQPDTPETPAAAAFRDVASTAYYYDAVQWAVSRGITSGTTAGTFSPDASCSRAQTVTFLWRAAGSPLPESTANPFTDVSPNAYYYNAVLWAVEQGVTSGTGSGTFSPDAVVTRGQTVAFLYRAAKSPAVSGGGTFGDVASDAYYADAVQWAVEHGVTGGTGSGLFSPGADCTRAQIVTFLYRGNGI